MNTIFNFFNKTTFTAIVLVAVMAGCEDKLVGIDGFCPIVESTNPENLATGVDENVVITVTFEEKINPNTMTPEAFDLSSGAAKASSNKASKQANVEGEMTYDDASNTMSFTPNAPLSSGTVYTGTVSNTIEDPLGNRMLEDYVWSFTTGDAPIPAVVSTDPQDQELDVALNKIVTATFSRLMDALSIDETTFTLFDDNTTQINGSVSYNSNDTTASFEPDVDLSSGTTYTATINNDVVDENGTALESDYVWTFTTLPEEQVVLGTAESYGIMATSAITNTGNTVINGDASLDPGTSITGFPPGEIMGDLNINNTESAQARQDLLEAYNYYKSLPPGTTISGGADLGALYPNGIPPGTTEADVTLANGANESNVFWVPTEDATIGVATVFHGTIVAGRDVTAKTGTTINGRILSGAITAGTIALDATIVNVPGFQP